MIDRRKMLFAAGMLPTARLALTQTSPTTAAELTVKTEPEGTITTDYAKFATSLRYEDLPNEVVEAAKRCLIDAIGCGLGGWQTHKGRLAADAMTRLGGPAEAQLWGGKARIATTNAAFANAELMNGLDFDAIPHIPPVILPALVAVAEARWLSGKQLLLSIVVAYELAARLSSASSPMAATILETGTTPEVFGINHEAIMAATAGLGSLTGMTLEQTAHAIGIGGYYCPPQTSHDWETGTPKSDIKYTPVGWINQGAVTAHILAESGYSANPRVLDGPAGFARFYGWSRWDIAAARRGLGAQWRILTADYKPYACCRYIHSRIDALMDVIAQHDIQPADIESIMSWGPIFVANPDQHTIRTQPDAQFSIPYMLAIVALGIPLDAQCQSSAYFKDKRVRTMMAKIRWDTHPRTAETKRADPRSFIASVEVKAGGKTYAAETMFARGNGAVAEMRMTDPAMDSKFIANARISMPADQSAKLLRTLRSIEILPDIAELGKMLAT